METKEYMKMFVLLFVLIIFEFAALYYIQKAQKDKQKSYLVYTMLLYGIPISLLLYKLLDFKSIAIVNFMWNIFSTLSGFIITLFIFKEKIHNLEWIGAALGILSIGLIILGGKLKEKGK